MLTGDERRRRLGRVRRMAAVLGRLGAAYAGVTVEGRLQSSHWSGDVKQYAYVDSREARCERTGAEGGA
ncbi:hypothetical protein BX257_8908 [Streptomyces sp. 3212.3]|nr:hypothetical protein BX257_8908 [Streptomyces sp. 3212.3]